MTFISSVRYHRPLQSAQPIVDVVAHTDVRPHQSISSSTTASQQHVDESSSLWEYQGDRFHNHHVSLTTKYIKRSVTHTFINRACTCQCRGVILRTLKPNSYSVLPGSSLHPPRLRLVTLLYMSLNWEHCYHPVATTHAPPKTGINDFTLIHIFIYI